MKTIEFLNNRDNIDIRSDLSIRKYISLSEKKDIATKIIFGCTEDYDGAIIVDSVQKEMLFIKYMILSHTSLEYFNEDYDMMCENEAFDEIFNCFRRDFNDCRYILDIMLEDYVKNNSIEVATISFLNKIGKSIEKFTDNVNEKIQSIDFDDFKNGNFDAEKAIDFINKYLK